MTERQKAILLLPFVLIGGSYLGWTRYQESRTAADPANWTQTDATVGFTRRDCSPTQRTGGGCSIAVHFADVDGPMRCNARDPACAALHGRLQRGMRVRITYRCAPGPLEFGRSCRLGALSLGPGQDLLTLDRTTAN